MKVIVCVDDKKGVSFNDRRQSRDKLLSKKILEMISKSSLYLSPYSAKLFEGVSNLKISEDYLKVAPRDSFCFVEREDLNSYEEEIEVLILVKWNRVYPKDKELKLDFSRFVLVKLFDFAGNSHEKITVEMYEKNR